MKRKHLNILSTSNEKLIARCLQNETAAQQELYQQYAKAMYHTAIRMVDRKVDAEDIVQETFIKAFRSLGSFQGKSTIGAWIKRICINTCLNHIQRNRRMPILSDVLLEAPLLEEEEKEFPIKMKDIHHAIKQLPDGCRLIFCLYLLEGYQHKEISELLQVTESTSKTQYRRARILLQKLLKHWKT